MMPRLCLLLVTLVPCVVAQSDDDTSRGSNRVRIRIENASNRACDIRTRVSLVSSSGPTVAEGNASPQCVVEFFSVPAGNYHVVVSGPGIAGEREFAIDANKTQELEVPVSASGEPKPLGASSATVAASELTVPRSAKKKFDSASQLIAKNDLPRALAQLHKAIDIDPTYAEAYNDLGVVYGRMGEKTQSREALQAAIRLDDHLAPAYVNLARLEIADRSYADAERLLGKATASGLDDAPTLILLASVQLLTQHYDQAVANCRKAHASPQAAHAAAHYIAARAYEHENRPAEALAELQILLGEEPSGARADAARKEMSGLRSTMQATR
jgi:tetratricopeptide (TPR) repeat protein